MTHKFTNRLIEATSPYLLQHAHNPVDWFSWGEEALQKAIAEDKPIIVSIGYSACHWCHVMERECFEKEPLAQLMNEHFVCIKIDREERPDIDHIYMDAVQNMGIRGGWPLNVFLTSTAEPFYGGTYFPPQQWQSILGQIAGAYQNHRSQIEDSAKGFTRSLNRSELEKYGLAMEATEPIVNAGDLETAYKNLEKNFDKELGGMNRAPKFPMPSNYFFLLRLAQSTGNAAALDHVRFTLKRMALGGIYDQVGGGFARYSTDSEWFLPHFEKMLYDNGQLLSLYAEAYIATREPLFKDVVYETAAFIKRELTSLEGGFYSALDADSEGEEGKFYVWKALEIQNVTENESELFSDYFNVVKEGNWENGQNILFANDTIEAYCRTKGLDVDYFKSKVKNWKQVLLSEREKRMRPGLDDKILASWNGLMFNGLVDAYRAFDEPEFLMIAEQNATFILNQMTFHVPGKSGDRIGLYHSYKNGKASIMGFLEDYAFVIQGLINLYQATFNEQWLKEAERLAAYAMEQFIDVSEEFFFFTAKDAEKLIARKKEIFDNVVPASNSAMAINLYWLGILLDNNFYSELSGRMLSKIKKMVVTDPGYLSNWGNLLTYKITTTKEIAISGKEAVNFRKSLDKLFLFNKIFAGTESKSILGLLQGREAYGDNTMIYVCENKTCQLPVNNTGQAIELLIK